MSRHFKNASSQVKMAYKLRTEIGQAIYRLRKCTVEPVIGIIKAVLGFRQFSLRGLALADGEWCLVCLAFNLTFLVVLLAVCSQTSTVQSETIAGWLQIATPHRPQARYTHGMAYDSQRDVTVLFGGDSTGTSRLNDTWEYDGNDWQQISPVQSPTGRVNIWQAIVYDSGRSKTIVFGGLSASGYLNDTWEYNGTTWIRITTSLSPSRRDAHAMAYDANRGVTVLFGGYSPSSSNHRFDDTWEYNGTTWQQVSLAQLPTARSQHAMAYDSRRKVVVLFGGLSASDTGLNDTWEYNGSTWRQISTSQAPPARSAHSLTYDVDRGVTILLGGFGPSGVMTDTWEYDGSSWRNVDLDSTPFPGRGFAPVVYDHQRHKAVYFGGGYWTSQLQLLNDTWEYGAGATLTYYSLSGWVTDGGGAPISSVAISDGVGHVTSTDNSGMYVIHDLVAGTYTLTPNKSGYSFTPARRTVNVFGNVTGQDFRGVTVTPFLNLPFDYGGTEMSFVISLYDTDNGGRVNSWFDHDLPTYITKNYSILLYDARMRAKNPTYPGLGCYEGRCYDGHNGFDFSYDDPYPELPGKQPLPIHPAADGVVIGVVNACNDTCRYGSCTSCGSYGNYVVINHQNGYFTRYAHLSQVYVSPTNQSVTTGDMLGTMGNTGNVAVGDGTHLHFSVHLDSNGNGQWDEESIDRPLDPCGYMGDSDPWVVSGGPVSAQLWEYACAPGQQASVSANQSAVVTDATGHTTATVPPGAISGSATLELAPGPVAGASARLRSTGGSFWLHLLEWLPGGSSQLRAAVLPEGTAAFTLTQPVTLTVAFSQTDVLHLDVSQLTLRLWDADQGVWQPLPTEVDPVNHVVTSTCQYLGDFDLQAPLLCTTDALEPDDGYPSAAPFWPNDPPLDRGLDIPQDSDWVRFHAAQGATYTIRTQNLAGGADTVLTLYDTDALTALASNDNVGSDPASELTWTAPYTGTYFVEVTSAPSGATDCTATYRLSIATTAGLAVTISHTTGGALLTWPHDPLYPNYQVRRGTTPFFTANDWSELLADVPAPGSDITASYTDTDAFTTAGTSYFYVVLPTDADGEPYLVSNRIGGFTFALTPGASP